VECPEVYKTEDVRVQSMIKQETRRVSAAGTISLFMKKKMAEDALEEVHTCMYQFFNKDNVAIGQGTSPEFIKLLTYCVNNAAYLKLHESQLKIGPQK
jgi:hypothetical protein